MEYREKITKQIDDAIKEVEIGYRYCPKCKEYYKEMAWENKDKIEVRKVCTHIDPVQWSENEYENKKCSVSYSICPIGHMIEENITY